MLFTRFVISTCTGRYRQESGRLVEKGKKKKKKKKKRKRRKKKRRRRKPSAVLAHAPSLRVACPPSPLAGRPRAITGQGDGMSRGERSRRPECFEDIKEYNTDRYRSYRAKKREKKSLESSVALRPQVISSPCTGRRNVSPCGEKE
ncbi:hypothetical protein GW17_00002911 [Ensete ventricosum]|nr:hypothetical protein GW17_00002911 [Ensete ventricosum]